MARYVVYVYRGSKQSMIGELPSGRPCYVREFADAKVFSTKKAAAAALRESGYDGDLEEVLI